MAKHQTVAAIAAILLSARVLAQDALPSTAGPSQAKAEASQQQDEIVVRGRRMSDVQADLEKFVLEFVSDVAAPAVGRGYARWQQKVCIGVQNIPRDAAQFIADRISKEAMDVGLTPGEPGCVPAVSIIFAANATQLASELVTKKPRLFLPLMGQGGAAATREALDAFAKSDKPIRWWHTSVPTDVHSGRPAVGASPIGSGPDDAAPTGVTEGPSRIHSGIRDDLLQVIIIVDASKLQGMSWQQLADYLTMVSLAQISSDADLSAFDSILNLFDNPKAYSGLTDWDQSYIRALYSYDQEGTPVTQKNALVSEMTHREVARAQ
jgi:hypothetical protein